MEKIFDVKAIIIDKANNDKKTYFFVHNDTIANSMKIFQLKDGLIDEGKEINPQLKDLFDKTPNYYIDISSDLLIKLVDQLGGIDVGGVHIDGNAANNRRDNLRMICPNCDSQLETFKSKNKNSSRRNYWKEKILRKFNNDEEIKK